LAMSVMPGCMILCVMQRALLVIAFISTLMTASCMGTMTVKRPLAPVYNGPVSAEALTGRIAFSGIPGLRAEIEARLWQGGRSVGSFKGALVMRPPDDMRVVLYNSFGTTVMDMVRTGGRLEAYVPSKDALYVGDAPSILPPEGSEMVLTSQEGAHYLYAMLGGSAVREYVFDKRSALNARATVINEGGPLMEAEFAQYLFDGKVAHNINIPGKVVLIYGRAFRLEFTIEDPEAGEVPGRLIPIGRTATSVYDLNSLEAEE